MIPHWDLPIRFANGGIVCVEQDRPAEIANCVAVAAATRQGARVESPDSGIPSYLMQAGDIDPDGLRAALTESEPRASVIAHHIQSVGDMRAQHVRVLLEEQEN